LLRDTQFYYKDMLKGMACQLDYDFNGWSFPTPYDERSISSLENFIIDQKNKIPISKFFFETGRAVHYVDNKFDKGTYEQTDYKLFIEAMNMFLKFTGVEYVFKETKRKK